jgi:hypothetical protein
MDGGWMGDGEVVLASSGNGRQTSQKYSSLGASVWGFPGTGFAPALIAISFGAYSVHTWQRARPLDDHGARYRYLADEHLE